METGTIKIQTEKGKTPSVTATLVNNNLWLTKCEIAKLLHCFPQKIEANLRSLFKEHLLWESDCTYNHRYMDKGIEKQCLYYNLETVLFLSYRIHSFEASIFRRFVHSALCEHLQKKKTPPTPEIKLFWQFHPTQNYWTS